jgi:uncharacterized repeat protein (TIGR01451 family)
LGSPALRLRRPQLERLEDRTVPTVALTNYNGLNFGQTGVIQGFTIGGAAIPPDPQGAAGPYSYVEAVNLSVAIFDPRTNVINPTTDALDDFYQAEGNLPEPNPADLGGDSFTDPQVIFDNQTQRFVVGAMDVDPGPQFEPGSTGNNSSVYDLAVSRSSNPTTLTTADWNFYQIKTTEANEFSDFPGNLGFNAGALVVTLNEFNTTNINTIDHVLVSAINMSDLTNGVPQTNLHVYQSDFQGVNLRPTTMHDSTSANDPMWLIQEHPGANGLGDGQHIDVVQMTNVLSSSPTFTTTTLAVHPYTDVSLVPPRQPDGSVVTPEIDSRILKVAEQNNLLVAAHSVSVSSTEDDAQWYVIDVSSGTPKLKDQGDVSGGNNTYITYPGIDINPAGDLGMTYMQSGTDTATDFLSMYVTGRKAAGPPGMMEAPVVAQAGQQLYQDYGPSLGETQRLGDLSGINVDGNGNFWAINEFADNEPLPAPTAPSADWGTHITSFTLSPVADLSVTASGPATVTPGGSASYTITLTSNGPDAAGNVVLSDLLPAGATNATITPVSNPDGFSFTLASGAFTSTAVTVANGHQDVFTVTVSVPSSLPKGAVFDDIASVTSTTIDPNPSDNAATVTGSTGQAITISSNYNAVNYGQVANLLGGAGATPPDPQGAVGPSSYVEAINDAVAIFAPRTGTATPIIDTLDDFFGVRGNLPDPNPDPNDLATFFTDPQVIFDEQTQRFLVGVMEVDPGPQFVAQSTGNNSSVFDLAVSKSSNPTTLTTADWTFYQIKTTEANEFSDFPGNLGYNGGALVVTLNEFNTTNLDQHLDHVLVTAINMSDLTSGVPQASLRFYQSDFQGASLRPTTMHDSRSVNDPMWLVQEHLDASGNPDGQHIDVVEMTNVLSSTPTFTTTTLAVNAYAQAVQPLQPDGSGVTPALDSRILKVAEQGGTLVAAHTVSNAAGNQDLVQWYQIDVRNGTPVLHEQGDVGSGPNTYLYFPGIDINPAGDIGMSYIQSGTDSPDDFMSMYVTGRTPSDPRGTMEAPLLAQAGLQVYEDFGPAFAGTQRAGDLSGINVDANGNFWAINEFADDEALPTTPDNPVADPLNPAADWGTNVVSFTLPATITPSLVITALTPPSATEQKAIGTFTVATFTDSNPNLNINTLTATVNWGDDHSDTLTVANGGIVQNADGSFSILDGHTYAEEGSGLTFSVQVVDGGESASTTATISVADAALTAGTASASGGVEGVTATSLGATFSDANPAAPTSDFSGTINWGDGHTTNFTSADVSGSGGSYTVSGSHQYAEEGSFSITVTVVHGTASNVQVTGTAVVTDPQISTPVAANLPSSGQEGAAITAITGIATFTDPAGVGVETAAGDFTATINWGDTTSSPGTVVSLGGGNYRVDAPGHTYVEESVSGSPYSVTVTVKHDALAVLTSNAQTIAISDQPISTPVVTAPGGVLEGAATPANVTIATFSDPAGVGVETASGDFTATINWGDSGTASGTVVSDSNGNYHVTAPAHTYAEEGSYTITVTVKHDMLSAVSSTASVSVADQQITSLVVANAPSTAQEGAALGPITGLATFTDPEGPEAMGDYTATINWGDSTTSTGMVVNTGGNNFQVNAPAHTYAEEGSYTVSVTVTHDLLSAVTATAGVTVADANVAATGGFTFNAVVGSASAVQTVATFTDPGGAEPNPSDPSGTIESHYSASIDWGDKTTSAGTLSFSAGVFSVAGSHTYLVAGTFTIKATISHESSTAQTASSTANVSDDAVIAGTSGNDTLVLSHASGTNAVSYQLNGAAPVTLSNLHTFTFSGGAGDDTMTVNLDPANPLLPSFIKFDGGTGNNSLVVNGASTGSSLFITQPPGTAPLGLDQITESPMGGTQISARQAVIYVNVGAVAIDNPAAINAEVGPNTAARGTAFAGLSAQERAVQALYLAALGRPGSKPELDMWVALLPSGATSLTPTVVSAIESSAEARDHLVKSWYISYLGRQATSGEEQGYVNLLLSGGSEEQALSILLSGREFFNRAQMLVSSGTPQERFVQALYGVLLNRTASANELAAWVNALPSLGQQGVAQALLQSQEFRTDQFEGYYNALLHRPADPTGLNAWVLSNLDMRSVRIDFEVEPEFFANG